MPRIVNLVVLAGLVMASRVAANTSLTVRVWHEGVFAPKVLAAAEIEASFLLADAGVEIQWLNCNRAASSDLCAGVPEPNDVILRLLPHVAERREFGAEVLGRSIGLRDVSVYCDVADRIVKFREIPIHIVYAMAISHELGHLLLGRAHAPTGLMRAKWGIADFDAAAHRRLRFSADECARIRRSELLRLPRVPVHDADSPGAETRDHVVPAQLSSGQVRSFDGCTLLSGNLYGGFSEKTRFSVTVAANRSGLTDRSCGAAASGRFIMNRAGGYNQVPKTVNFRAPAGSTGHMSMARGSERRRRGSRSGIHATRSERRREVFEKRAAARR